MRYHYQRLSTFLSSLRTHDSTRDDTSQESGVMTLDSGDFRKESRVINDDSSHQLLESSVTRVIDMIIKLILGIAKKCAI